MLVLPRVRIAQQMTIGSVEYIMRGAVRKTGPADAHSFDHAAAAKLRKDQIRVKLVRGVLGVWLDAADVVRPSAVYIHHQVSQLAPELLAKRLADSCIL